MNDARRILRARARCSLRCTDSWHWVVSYVAAAAGSTAYLSFSLYFFRAVFFVSSCEAFKFTKTNTNEEKKCIHTHVYEGMNEDADHLVWCTDANE